MIKDLFIHFIYKFLLRYEYTQYSQWTNFIVFT